ncbi:MAG: PatB family C-S lyase [Thiobacillaceae bacterium]|nr:PatB family C-S lyase [Thiobacillaceae bacterium]MCX7673121.1 PatB family C-S lyase [Thiobacillaceae bacterium]MDW8323501.1 PatB family C-S lyase [Burkholderiales bacterium]
MPFDFDTPIDRSGTATVKYERRAARFGQADVLPLWVADMDFATPPCVVSALTARCAHPIYGYTIVPESAVQAVADWQLRRHGWCIDPDWVLIGPGLLPLYAACITAYTRAGETVALPTPVYDPLFAIPQRLDRQVLRLPLIQAGGLQALDGASWARMLTPGTRLLVLCSPHNPGGRVWRTEELAALGELAQRHDLLIISDEIHADLVYPGHRHQPIASLTPQLAARTITLGSPGKTFNTAGLATAYAIVPDAALRALLQQAMQAHGLEGPNLFGLAALVAAYREGGPWLEALIAYLRGNRDHTLAWLAQHLPLVRPHPPEASFLLWLDCRALGLTDDELMRRLVAAGLGLTPGRQFGPEGSGFVRLNYALPRARLDEALTRLAIALK